jgi:hypothetical protein
MIAYNMCNFLLVALFICIAGVLKTTHIAATVISTAAALMVGAVEGAAVAAFVSAVGPGLRVVPGAEPERNQEPS